MYVPSVFKCTLQKERQGGAGMRKGCRSRADIHTGKAGVPAKGAQRWRQRHAEAAGLDRNVHLKGQSPSDINGTWSSATCTVHVKTWLFSLSLPGL